jgi:hypothetical protein
VTASSSADLCENVLQSGSYASQLRYRTTISQMPFKSQAQRRKFAQLLVEGKISNDTFEEWNRDTGGKRLPERVGRPRKSSTKARAKTDHSVAPGGIPAGEASPVVLS